MTTCTLYVEQIPLSLRIWSSYYKQSDSNILFHSFHGMFSDGNWRHMGGFDQDNRIFIHASLYHWSTLIYIYIYIYIYTIYIKSTCRQCHNCKEQFRISKTISSKSSNPLIKICQKIYEKCNKEMTRKKKDLAYDCMKEELFIYLKNNIPLQSIELDQRQYYDFVTRKKYVSYEIYSR